MKDWIDLGHRIANGMFSPHRLLVRTGLVLAALGGGGIGFQAVVGGVSFGLSTGSPLTWLSVMLALSGVIMIAGGSIAALRNADRRRVFALQVLGLRSVPDAPLVNRVPARLQGRREPWPLDLRDPLQDGMMIDPLAAANEIRTVPSGMRQRANGRDPGDTSFVVAGLAPVPLLMLLGYELDDEFEVTVMDWDRSKERWFEPARGGDTLAIATEGLDEIEEGTREAAVSLSVSYGIRPEDVVRQIGDLPHVRIHMPHTSAKWRDEQEQIAQTWFDALKTLQARGVDRVHLFVAAPASLAIQLGRRYDWRNLPSARVYQYDRDAALPYPWSLALPRPGEAPVVHHHSGAG
ncbi:SAVED domain-containing protein [Oceanicaulis sp.]|uniref:SAVED domain-containing protein n=1 Tax=Oceanicaulis sp. TaxID=1924941 RepID=UPI003BAB1C47